MRMPRVCLFLTAILLSTPIVGSADTSFNEIKKKIYESPRKDLPAYHGLSTWDVVRNLFGSEDRPTHGLTVRSRITFVDTSDYRKPEPKWLHPRGVCASGRWIITEENPATGFFSKGTNVPAVIRLSSGDSVSDYSPTNKKWKGRISGMAVKLYPGFHPDQVVTTRNFVTLDQDGFERSRRKHFFHSENATDQVYFTNVAPAKSALGKFLSSFFDRFDQPNFARPLYQIATATLGGDDLSTFVSPYELRFSAADDFAPPAEVYGDFRTELIQKQKRALKILIYSFDGRTVFNQEIGRLEFDDFVVSDFCDLELHFHHNPIQDQWSKYNDYEVVKDFQP